MTKVVFEWHGRRYSDRVDRAIRSSLEQAVDDGAAAAKLSEPKLTGAMAAGTHGTGARPSRRGYAAAIEAPGPALFQELGTKGRRTKKLRGSTTEQHRARRTTLGRAGIKPHRFLSRGLRIAQHAWLGHMRRAL